MYFMGWDYDQRSILKTTKLIKKASELIKILTKIPLFRTITFLDQYKLPEEINFNPKNEPNLQSHQKVIDFDITEGSIVFLLNDGSVYVRGDNYRSQLGFPNSKFHIFEPTLLNLDETINKVSCGFNFTLFKTTNNKIFGTGAVENSQFALLNRDLKGNFNEKTELKMTIQTNEILEVTGSPFSQQIIDIFCGRNFSLYLDSSRKIIFGVGRNYSGELGMLNDEFKNIDYPLEIFNLKYLSNDPEEIIIDVIPGHLHTFIQTNSNIYFIGNVKNNQLDSNLFNYSSFTFLNNFRLDLSKVKELTGSDKIVKIRNSYNNNAFIMDNGICLIFGGQYFDKENKDFEILTYPDGI